MSLGVIFQLDEITKEITYYDVCYGVIPAMTAGWQQGMSIRGDLQ